ncbi:hypothetical protein NPIL_611501 [Nephila pilipes]|uniref:Uncharacterized protein n=1 Tax=Nephila pilipes TaxID=299642 RepID=A0A8X6TZ98_NEPPI|nr:hypothetical protein NPIL_611501 [Nephila pilipes]
MAGGRSAVRRCKGQRFAALRSGKGRGKRYLNPCASCSANGSTAVRYSNVLQCTAIRRPAGSECCSTFSVAMAVRCSWQSRRKCLLPPQWTVRLHGGNSQNHFCSW